ncbi:unnamed protein product, partial [Owenia fusiformis]
HMETTMSFAYLCIAVCLLNYIFVIEVDSQSDCGKLRKHSTATCARKNKDCPNAYTCVKSKLDSSKFVCCQNKFLPSTKKCKRAANDPVDEPRPCRGGGSIRCSENYYCHVGKANMFSLCCLNITCTDHQGLNRKSIDKKWKAKDNCNVCECVGQEQIVCSNKAKCKNKCSKNGEISWKDAGCTRCECKGKRLDCKEPCDRVEETGATSPMSQCPKGYGWQASVQRCDGVQGENNKTCPSIKLQWFECKPKLRPEPGVRLSESTSIITGGKEVKPAYNYRWMVHFKPPLSCGCGGSIISPKHVLTAAHCVKHGDRLNFTFLTGKHSLSINETFQQSRKASDIIIHPNYSTPSEFPYNNDIAIVELDQPLEFNNITQPVMLPKDGVFDMDKLKKKVCTVIGWGSTTSQERCATSDVLLKVNLNLVDTCFLSAIDLKEVSGNMFCAGNGSKGKDSCFGDSGGPLMCRDKGEKWIQHGIVSWGPVRSCGKKSGVYTKVANYVNWIKHETSTDGGWGEWSKFTPCQKGNGKKSRIRVCSNPLPIGNGKCSNYTHSYEDKPMVQIEEVNC